MIFSNFDMVLYKRTTLYSLVFCILDEIFGLNEIDVVCIFHVIFVSKIYKKYESSLLYFSV